jgi:hypothetical protein
MVSPSRLDSSIHGAGNQEIIVIERLQNPNPRHRHAAAQPTAEKAGEPQNAGFRPKTAVRACRHIRKAFIRNKMRIFQARFLRSFDTSGPRWFELAIANRRLQNGLSRAVVFLVLSF